jgi:hypothetical protein
MTEALARWVTFIGVLLDASGFQAQREPACKARPRRIGAQEWRAVKEVERRTGIEAVRILRAALHQATQQPSLVPLLRAVTCSPGIRGGTECYVARSTAFAY